MGALRLILLGAGLLFLALLAWLGSRRPRRVQSDDGQAPGTRGEPTMGSEAMHAWRTAAAPSGADSGVDAPDAFDALGPISSSPAPATHAHAEPPLEPPVVDWSDATAAAELASQAPEGSAAHAALVDLPVMPPSPDLRRGPPRGSPPEPAAPAMPPAQAATDATAPQPEGAPVLHVAWPPENERFIVTLRVVGARGARIQGRLLRQGLAATGFRHGPFGIYHVGHDDGRVLISAASLVRPGMLDPDSMDFQHYPGVNLFAVLPAPLAPADLLERFCTAAFDLAGRIEGSVQDEGGATLAAPDSADWRARCIAGFAQRAGAH
jgi:cell division protein ZipA